MASAMKHNCIFIKNVKSVLIDQPREIAMPTTFGFRILFYKLEPPIFDSLSVNSYNEWVSLLEQLKGLEVHFGEEEEW